MQRAKLFSFSHRLLSKQCLVKNTCVSKCLAYHGEYNFTRCFNKSLQLSTVSPFILKTDSAIHSIMCQRHRTQLAKDEKPSQSSSVVEDEKPTESKSAVKDERTEDISVPESEEPPEKLSLFQRYKKMLKEYWYVLLPVHMVTSGVWFVSFYYAATRGLDIVPFLEYINLPEYLIEPLRNSSLGHIAVASAIYKLATPARYMVTVGMTTFAVKFLTKRGLIRPVPTKAQIKTIIQNKMKKEADK